MSVHIRTRHSLRSCAVMRAARYLCWWHNSMRRREDRTESMVAAVLLVIFLAVWPLAIALARREYSHHVHQAETLQAQLHRGIATLTQNAPRVSGAGAITEADGPDVAAQWSGAQGQLRHGKVAAQYGDRKGTKIPVWLNSRNDIATPPDDRGTITANAVAMAISVIITAGFLLEITRRLVRRRLDKSRLSYWENEWRQIGPEWTRRRR